MKKFIEENWHKPLSAKQGVIVLIVLIIVVGGVIGNKIYIANETRKRIEEQISIFQEEMTIYITKNYEGVHKIEWKGWAHQPPKAGGVATRLILNDVSDKDYSGQLLFVFAKESDPEPVESLFDEMMDINDEEENDPDHKTVQKTLRAAGVKKSKTGSADAQIIYNNKKSNIWEQQ